MMIVGVVQSQEEAFDVQEVMKIAVVARRFRSIGERAYVQYLSEVL